jgi:hypothetical protein
MACCDTRSKNPKAARTRTHSKGISPRSSRSLELGCWQSPHLPTPREQLWYSLELLPTEIMMLFKNTRVGDEVILATPKGHGRDSGFTYTLVTVEAVKSALVVVDGFKFNRKDGRGRTVPHEIYPADAANRRDYLNGNDSPASAGESSLSAEAEAEDKQHKFALDALRIIREEVDPSHDADVIDSIGTENLAAFRRHWRKLHPKTR